MTERQWLARPAAVKMAVYVERLFPERKLRLLAHALCRRVEHLLPDAEVREALVAVEGYADGRVTRRDLEEHYRSVDRLARDIYLRFGERDTSLASRTAQLNVGWAVANATNPAVAPQEIGTTLYTTTIGAVAEYARMAVAERQRSELRRRPCRKVRVDGPARTESREQADLIRDIFGNPFRPVAFLPAWRTPTAVGLARAMYDSRDFTNIPVLADALEEAGCDNVDVLTHCRGDGPHVRGCWVVDGVLGL